MEPTSGPIPQTHSLTESQREKGEKTRRVTAVLMSCLYCKDKFKINCHRIFVKELQRTQKLLISTISVTVTNLLASRQPQNRTTFQQTVGPRSTKTAQKSRRMKAGNIAFPTYGRPVMEDRVKSSVALK